MKRLLPLLLLFSASSFAHAEDLATTKQALHLISDFADDFCKTPPLEGGTKDVTLSLGAKTELNRILKKVANLGVEGAAKYQSEHYNGLLQKDLVNALKDSSNCRLEIWRDLKDKLLAKKPKSAPPGKAKAATTASDKKLQAQIEKLKQSEEHNRRLTEEARLHKAEAEAEAAVREFSVRNKILLDPTANQLRTIAVLFRENFRAEEIDAYFELMRQEIGLVLAEKPGSLRRIRLMLDAVAQVAADSNVGSAIQGKDRKERIKSIANVVRSSLPIGNDQKMDDLRRQILRYPSLTLWSRRVE